jgi:protein-L-isoaspartate(D-aspartate) O-methyltransferase
MGQARIESGVQASKGLRDMLDFSVARENMIESQVRPNGITDRRVIDALAVVPREQFVPEAMKSLAYMDNDIALPVGEGGARRYLLEPMAYARMLQAARVKPGDIVLDVAGASGYSAAVLSFLAQTVVMIESDPALIQMANENLLRREAANVVTIETALPGGHPAEAPYDVIIINGRVAAVPDDLLNQLSPEGRLIAVVGMTDVSQARVYTRSGGTFTYRHAFDASVPSLNEFNPAPAGFRF